MKPVQVVVRIDELYPFYTVFSDNPFEKRTVELTQKEYNWISKATKEFLETQKFLAEKIKEVQ